MSHLPFFWVVCSFQTLEVDFCTKLLELWSPEHQMRCFGFRLQFLFLLVISQHQMTLLEPRKHRLEPKLARNRVLDLYTDKLCHSKYIRSAFIDAGDMQIRALPPCWAFQGYRDEFCALYSIELFRSIVNVRK